ncbi:telomere-associated protein RIF1-like [Daphnia carinata]|uniref:telomere-associated protein RIF1-like n=1 Tax=Daphnia carinata TaxID=120202 RepID=UPI00257BB4D2|nr:telomere-associated protein RIF1-like [Daphnia carinata]
MAVVKSPTKVAMASLMKSVSDLKNEKNPKSHLTIYETLTQLGAKSSFLKDETCNDILHSVAIPVTLQDISTGNDNLVLAALGFLGGLLQVVKLPLEKQALVIEVLTKKLCKVSEKNLSRKLMWSLANLQFDVQLQESHLKKMLQAACLFLEDNPPVTSLSTVCESLNALRNIGLRNEGFFSRNLTTVLSAALPWLFNEADRIRELSLACLEPFTASIAKRKLLDSSFQTLLRNKYYGVLSQLVSGESADSLKIWSFLIQAFGTQLHDSVTLLNELLKIEESALKCKNPVYRQCALEHWKYIIDCFALNPAVLNNSKRIKLVLVPLKSTDTRTVDFSITKIELWWHLLNRLGPDATLRFQEVTLPLLHFCFGVQDGKQTTKGTAFVFTNILPLATTVLAGILSLETEFKSPAIGNVELLRSYPFLNSEDFCANVESFSQWVLLTLNLKPKTDNTAGVYGKAIKSIIERCSSTDQREQLKVFILSLVETITSKPVLMEVVFDVITAAFSFSLLTELMTENMDVLLHWFVENEPLPAHPFVRFLTQFFEAGIIWNVAKFTSKIMNTLESLYRTPDEASKSASTELWILFARALISKSHVIDLHNANVKSLLLPLTWPRIHSNECLFHPWSTLLSTWAKQDSSIVEKVLYPRGANEVDAVEPCTHIVLSALRSELPLYFKEISSWIQSWAESWLKLANVEENRQKCLNLLGNFLSMFVDELKVEKELDLFMGAVKSCFPVNTLSKEVTEILNGIFGPPSAAVKAPNVQKLRKHNNICKIFAPLIQRNLLTKNKQKSKPLDDFVVIQTPEKKKRVLTEHQKEVMRDKRRATCGVPAMYNDLSQSSQTTDSMDTQSVNDTPVPSVVSNVTIVREEDALLEPPVILQQAEVLNELPGNENPVVGPGNLDQPTSVNEFFKKDSKLRSKVSVTMCKLPSRRSLRRSLPASTVSSQSPSSTEECPEAFQRPGPASKKRGFKKNATFSKPEANRQQENSLESPVEESHNKENGSIDSEVMQISSFPSSSLGNVQTIESADDGAKLSHPVVSSVSDEPNDAKTSSVDTCSDEGTASEIEKPSHVECVAEEPKSVSDALVKDWIDSDESVVEDSTVSEKQKELPTEISLDCKEELKENFLAAAEVVVDQTSNVNKDGVEVCPTDSNELTSQSTGQLVEEVMVVDTMPCTRITEPLKTPIDVPVLENNNTEGLIGSAHPETLQQKLPLVPLKSLIKSFSLRTKKGTVPKSVGPSPTTGKRGAHILELSRKIHNEPPSKKSKKTDSPPKEIGDSPICNTSMGELVVTPEGSPARTAPWLPRTYSPYASPSTGILKKRAIVEDSEEVGEGSYSPASSACKARRVSFADPEVSHSVKISPIKKKLSRARTRRSLITTYDNSLISEEPSLKEEIESSVSIENASKCLEDAPANEVVSISNDSVPADTLRGSPTTDEPSPDSCSLANEQESSKLTIADRDATNEILEPQDIEVPEEIQETAIYPAATDCIDSLALIVDRVTSPTSKGPILTVLEKLGVRTIGDFCALSETDIKGLDFKLPQHETIKQFLESHFARKSIARTDSQISHEEEGVDIEAISPTDTGNVESEPVVNTDELVKSLEEQKVEESIKTPDSSPNGQIIDDSPEMLFSSHMNNNEKNSCALVNSETTEVSDEIISDLGESHSCSETPTLLNTSSVSPKTNPTADTIAISRSSVHEADDLLGLSANEIVNIIERHPLKDEILSLITRKYVSLSFTLNGKVFPISNNF